MSRLLVALTFLALLAAPAAAQAAPLDGVTLSASGGYGGYYRPSAWVPIRVSLRNASVSTVAGTLSAQGAADAPRAPRYTESVVLAPGVRKVVTLYVRGADVQGTVDVTYRDAGGLLDSTSVYPNPYGDTDFVVGTLSDDPAAVAWVSSVRPWGTSLRVVNLVDSTLDPSPGALSTFDAIVVSNVDTSRLTETQLRAIEEYVRTGGALIEVGGADWQATLATLPGDLLPARPVGTTVARSLDGLASLGDGVPPSHIVTLTRFGHVRGAALAAERGTPLLIKAALGDGQIELLAFDPSVAPINRWSGSRRLLTTLVAGAAPLSMRRVGLAPVDRVSSFLNPGPQVLDMGAELANLSQTPLATVLALPLILAAAALLILVGGGVVLLRWRRRLSAWLTLAVVAALCLLGARLLTPVARGQAFVNSLSVVFMGPGTVHPADRYVALLSPVSGDYSLTYPAAAQVQDVPPPRDFDASAVGAPPAAFAEGPTTRITLPGVQTWTSRAVELQTTMALRGSVGTHLAVDATGNIVGSISNSMPFPLQRPALIAGTEFVRLPDIPPGGTTRLHIVPRADVQDHDYDPVLSRVYGEALPDYAAMLGHRFPGLPGAPAGMPPERTLDQRIKNAVSALPERQLLPLLGEVTLVAWSDRKLDPINVAGSAASHRDLTMFIQPISVGLQRGSFRLPTGVLGARTLEVVPKQPRYPCCGPTIQPVSLGSGGQAIFGFQLPQARYTSLSLDAYAGGADVTSSGYTGMPAGALQAYDWRAGRWQGLTFSGATSRLTDPIRFISYTGTLLLRLVATARSGDLTILDPGHDLQLHGAGTA